MKNIDHYKTIHKQRSGYGAGSVHYNFIFPILVYLRARSVIDFGCGKGVLSDYLNANTYLTCEKYDPAIEEYSSIPSKKFDCLINTDVLEHVPEDELDMVLKNLPELSDQAIVIPHLEKANLILPNGENAHCTLKSPEEWKLILNKYYKNVEILPHRSSQHVLLLCSQYDVDIEPLHSALLNIKSLSTDPNLICARVDDPFRRRLRRAIKLVIGKQSIKLNKKR